MPAPAYNPDRDDGLWTFKAVEARLIEAFTTLQQLPDRELGWMGTKTMALWREVRPEAGDYLETTPARLGVRLVAYQEMSEALGWCEWLSAGDARRLMGQVVQHLVRSGRSECDWPQIWAAGWHHTTTDALRMRYSRGVTIICRRLNARLFTIKPCQ